MVKDFIKKLIKQYITCKHEKYKVVREIWCPTDNYKNKYLEKRRCKKCDRLYYSDYFYKYGKERHYIKGDGE